MLELPSVYGIPHSQDLKVVDDKGYWFVPRHKPIPYCNWSERTFLYPLQPGEKPSGWDGYEVFTLVYLYNMRYPSAGPEVAAEAIRLSCGLWVLQEGYLLPEHIVRSKLARTTPTQSAHWAPRGSLTSGIIDGGIRMLQHWRDQRDAWAAVDRHRLHSQRYYAAPKDAPWQITLIEPDRLDREDDASFRVRVNQLQEDAWRESREWNAHLDAYYLAFNFKHDAGPDWERYFGVDDEDRYHAGAGGLPANL